MRKALFRAFFFLIRGIPPLSFPDAVVRISNESFGRPGGGVMENAVKVVNLWHKANYYHWIDLSLQVKLQISFSGGTMNLWMRVPKPVAHGEHQPRDQ
jgi:hypothetical protein